MKKKKRMDKINKEINHIMNKILVIYAKNNLVLMIMIKNILKVRDHCYYKGKYTGLAHICNSRYNTPKEIPVVFHNGSKYNYHFIIKKLAKKI